MLFQWTEVCVIGRDLVRLLQDVARVPEFEKLWKEILYNPSAVHPTFKGEVKICLLTIGHYVTT